MARPLLAGMTTVVLSSLLLLAACGAGAPPQAMADQDESAQSCTPTGPQQSRTVETRELRANVAGTRVEKHPIVVLEGIELCAGRPHRFYGGFTSTVSENMLKGTDIRCTPVDGNPGSPQEQSLRRSVLSTRNHGRNVGEPRAIGVRWLFTPLEDGRYDCELRGWGQARAGSDGEDTVTVVDGADTVLSVSGVEDSAMEWRQDEDVYLCHDADDPVCDPSGVVLEREPGEVFEAAEGAQSIDVYAGVEASICAEGYKECSDGTAGMGDFTIKTRLIATQLRNGTSATLCPGARAHVKELTTPVAGGGELNHTKIHVDMDDPVPVVDDPDCSREFAIRVLVDYVRTNPETPNHGGLVEGSIPDGDPADPEALNRAYTSAMAFNNF